MTRLVVANIPIVNTSTPCKRQGFANAEVRRDQRIILITKVIQPADLKGCWELYPVRISDRTFIQLMIASSEFQHVKPKNETTVQSCESVQSLRTRVFRY
ncbi:hypothetical protein [Rubripirellula reticaptiva]|uniref:Uncharacterized protein n=1 Tax=Rubripirellula reticaptiva TaxID=2528013 RepID=A0A5C6FBV8_9BACT|nr:hypothetical protein [Rubripirellula reticaptiva]TWU58272.1 hypothetical protein Poly59_11830 [Rubripirellula reticaptiva]